MPQQQYSTVASRNLIRAEQKLLKEIETIEVLGKFGTQEMQPLNKTDTIVFRRLKPYNMSSTTGAPQITASSFILAEGTTPAPGSLDFEDVTVTLLNYGYLYEYSSKAAEMYEDDIPAAAIRNIGRTLAEVKELVAFGVVKAGTNVRYANGSARTSVNTAITIDKLRLLERDMQDCRAEYVTEAVSPGPNYDTHGVEPCYIIFHHTDVCADIRKLDGYTPRVKYGTAITPVCDREWANVENFRFVSSPLFAPWADGGGSVTGTGMKSTSATSCDVYPCIVMGMDAFGHVSLKGKKYSGITPVHIPHTQRSHMNPLGLFGYVGADFWYAAVRLNEYHMTRFECAVSALS